MPMLAMVRVKEYAMRKNVLEKLIDVAMITLIMTAIHLRNGGGLEVSVQVLCYMLMASVIGITVVDTVHIAFEEPELANWKLYVGSAILLAGAWMHGRFFFSESWFGYIYAGISLVLYGCGVWWMVSPYHLSVIGKPALEVYRRKRFSGRIERCVEKIRKAIGDKENDRAKKLTGRLRRLLAHVLLFYCPNNNYKAIPAFGTPFDPDNGKDYHCLARKQADGDAVKAEKAWQHICTVADMLIQTGYNGEDLKAMDDADRAKKEAVNTTAEEE